MARARASRTPEAEHIEAELQRAHAQALLASLTDAYQRYAGRASGQATVETLVSTVLFLAAATLAHLRLAVGPGEAVPWDVWRALVVEEFGTKLDLVRQHCTCEAHR